MNDGKKRSREDEQESEDDFAAYEGRIDLSKMEVWLPSTTPYPHPALPTPPCPTYWQAASLRRYRKVHKLGDSPPGSSKEELLPAVARHFAAQIVDEFETLSKLAATLKKQAEHGSLYAPAAAKKPRAAAKR